MQHHRLGMVLVIILNIAVRFLTNTLFLICHRTGRAREIPFENSIFRRATLH